MAVNPVLAASQIQDSSANRFGHFQSPLLFVACCHPPTNLIPKVNNRRNNSLFYLSVLPYRFQINHLSQNISPQVLAA
ncbi:hypothetical protein L1987_36457 [Smallanthus sonchifolius]|uniref:Uncharacterized protein n=1 Tax=Smallanthus sonchifolius TaxID=185202 RepID=A0ACB9HDN2_9ASTR|nr:hypothetical protein L1987_36457 [Smallanthus sonchifolius]